MRKSTQVPAARKARNATAAKPAEPRADVPLFPHATGKWAKVIRGKTHYFGRWDDPNAAKNEYLVVADHLHARREP